MEKKYNLILSIPITSKRDDKFNMLTEVYELLKDNPFHVNIVDALLSLNNCICNGMRIGNATITLEQDTNTSPYQLKARYVGTNPYTHKEVHKTFTQTFKSLNDLNDWIEKNRELEYPFGFGVTTNLKIESWQVYSIQKNRLC